MRETGFFLQDSWRWKPNLTINVGLRYSLQFPFTASNNSYTTPTVEDVCGRSGVNSAGDGLQPVPAGRDARQGESRSSSSLKKGKNAYNTDYNNLAPNVGIAWTPAPRGGFLGTLMSEEFVFRAGWARAFSRNGMDDFTGQYNSNPGVVVSANRNAGLLNIIPPGGIGTGAVPQRCESVARVRSRRRRSTR